MPELPRPESASGVAELEWPQEIGGLFEVGSDGDNLVEKILHADDAVFAKLLLDQSVIGERDSLLGDLAVSALVEKVADGLDGGVAICNVGFDDFQHFTGSLSQFDENAAVDLDEAEELEDFTGLGGNLVDTMKTLLSALWS